MRKNEKLEKLKDWLQVSFSTYLQQFNLSSDDLKNKKILEIGAYDRRFAAACALMQVTPDVYSVEPSLGAEEKDGYAEKDQLLSIMNQLPSDVQEYIEQHTLVNEAEKIALPDDSVDIVLGRSVPWQSRKQLLERLREGLRLAPEISLFPITEQYQAEFNQVLEELQLGTANITFDYVTTVDTEVPTESGNMRIQDKVLIVRRADVQ